MPYTRPILIVEDHAVVRQMLVRFLESQGVLTIGASNGQEGLAALRAHAPSLVVLDLQMPVMNGWQFRQEQLQLPDPHLARIPVVILSADPEVRHHAATLHAIEGLSKPVDLGRLWSIVRRYTGDSVRPTVRGRALVSAPR